MDMNIQVQVQVQVVTVLAFFVSSTGNRRLRVQKEKKRKAAHTVACTNMCLRSHVRQIFQADSGEETCQWIVGFLVLNFSLNSDLLTHRNGPPRRKRNPQLERPSRPKRHPLFWHNEEDISSDDDGDRSFEEKILKMTLTLKTEKEKNITSDGRNTGRCNHRPITRSVSSIKHERMHRHRIRWSWL